MLNDTTPAPMGADALAELHALADRIEETRGRAMNIDPSCAAILRAALASAAQPTDQESSAEDALTSLLAECRDAFPVPPLGDPLGSSWACAMSDPSEVPGYLRAIAAAPKAAPAKQLQEFESPRAKTLMRAWEEGWEACRDAEFVGEEAQNDAFNRSGTVNHCIAEDQLHASRGQAPAPAMPEGWVPLTITHDGQHPEEVAYGPQRMMDRLGKWLDRYFAMLAAPKAAPAAQGDALPGWLPITPELLTAIEAGEHGDHFWLAAPGASEAFLGVYEWRQGRSPHGFKTDFAERWTAAVLTHVMPYSSPALPGAARAAKEGGKP